MAEDNIKPYYKNASGPFVVNDGECIACGAPEAEAPDLMAFDEEGRSCYFKKQPETPEELDRALRAVCVSCCEAVRYTGNDSKVLERRTIVEAQLREEGQKRMQGENW